ncbi:amino acid aminotransferase [Niveispirillum sp.]|uniref:amino acid aminotransferase n=1 Tax=Niveispirillum sp. TaxID=1917217 RepID=UPI001B6A9589|nr:amino acid aminotransferase [Niveispirillum sp.]MBP7334326.1 aspartate/tyrosine/aromatic aminotransferase [Niveispirillum sp.]
MFTHLAEPPQDPILGLSRLFAADPSPHKVDLGIGVYKDGQGEVAILPSVKVAEAWLLANQHSKRYLSSAGNADYNRLMRDLLFGEGTDLAGRARTVQAPGGTGALRLAAEFLHRLRPGGRVFIPDPTWANHRAIFAAAGHTVVTYPYYDVARGTLRFDAMMEALGGMESADVLLLHGCCHNPSGADPDAGQWAQIADLLARTGAFPLVDLAYLGFADGLDADAVGTRLLAARLPEMLVASSCSKNFALYRERVGALTLVGETAAAAELAQAHLMPIIRTNYSMPPDHGAAIVAHILGDAALKAQWREELRQMRNRINAMRSQLVGLLADRCERDFGFLGRQRGMFALLGIGPDAVARLRSDHHVHITGTGRANVAGLTEDNVERVADGIAAVCRL